jgi:predicted transglutaminase-like cysteine proteinase
MTSYITTFGATCSQTLNTLSSTVTLNETYEEPYELQYFALRYYVSEIVEGTATVCIDAVDCHAWTGTFWTNAEQLAAQFAYIYNMWAAENFATSAGAKCYVTLTEEQVAAQIALWEESSPIVVSNAPNIIAAFLLPFYILRAVFADPSIVDGTYDQPVLVNTTEVTSTETITVSDNTQISAGDTLTNNVGGIPFVYTFRNLPTGAANEIIIGATAAITAANIATALNATDGAIFTATASSDVVSVTEYTSETVTKSTTSVGVTIGVVIQSVLYTTPDPVATLPALTSNGLCSDGTGFLPAFTASGTCTQDDFCIGRGVLPAATCNAQSFISGLNYDSTKLEKISLLLNGNGFMQSFAPMVCVTDPDEAALLAVQFAANYITHTPDVIVWGTTESWVCPRGTLYYAQGDCEDGAFLIASLLLNIGVSSSKVKVAIGYYDDTGHAWAMYQRASDDIWVNLDWTKGSTYWNAISSVDELPIAFSEA